MNESVPADFDATPVANLEGKAIDTNWRTPGNDIVQSI
jgi:hypothetical protein